MLSFLRLLAVGACLLAVTCTTGCRNQVPLREKVENLEPAYAVSTEVDIAATELGGRIHDIEMGLLDWRDELLAEAIKSAAHLSAPQSAGFYDGVVQIIGGPQLDAFVQDEERDRYNSGVGLGKEWAARNCGLYLETSAHVEKASALGEEAQETLRSIWEAASPAPQSLPQSRLR